MRAYTALVTRGDSTLQRATNIPACPRARAAATVRDLKSCLVLIDSKIALYGRWIKTGRSRRKPPVGRERKSGNA